MYHESTVDLGSGNYPVQELIDRFEKVKKDCGADTLISIDAGHNTISFEVVPSRKRPRNIWDFPSSGGQLEKVKF